MDELLQVHGKRVGSGRLLAREPEGPGFRGGRLCQAATGEERRQPGDEVRF